VAHPLTLLNKKYGLLISTSYTEDRNQRIKELNYFRKFIDTLAQKHMIAIEKNILQQAGFTWALSNYSIEQFKMITSPVFPPTICCGHPMDCSNLPSFAHKKEKTIIALGRFSDPRKNIAMLLRVFEKIYHVIPEVKLYVVGHKPTDDKLRAFSHLPSFENVVFTGQVSADDLSHILTISSLMLITSYQEGFGIAGIEGLLYGIPIVSTRCGGPQDFVVDDVTGYLVNVNDDQAMAERSLSILINDERRLSMAHNAQQFVINNYETSHVYSLFKQGFIHMYPELETWFARCNVEDKNIQCLDDIKPQGYENSCY
jgi:glycosyltransferase involved in cell wall biosynthesis